VDVLERPLVVDHNPLGGRIIIIIIITRGYLGSLDKAKSLQQVVRVDKTSHTERFKVQKIPRADGSFHSNAQSLLPPYSKSERYALLPLQRPCLTAVVEGYCTRTPM
jgi:hypothetical protein